jgi:hypothetical protein
MIYTHVRRQGVASEHSPLDLLDDVTDADVEAGVVAHTSWPLIIAVPW